MSTITFDTLKFVEKLEAGGFTHQQAKATAEAFAEATGQEFVTKRDLHDAKVELKADMALGFAKVNGEMTLVKWMLGVLLAGVISLVAKTFF